MGSLRDDILEVADLRFEDVVVPEWKGVRLRVQELGAADRADYEDAVSTATEENGGKDSTLRNAALLLSFTLRDPQTGERVFRNEDLSALSGRTPRVIMRLFRVAARLCVLTEKDVEAEGKDSGGPRPA